MFINCYNLGEIDGGTDNKSYAWTAGLLGGAFNASNGTRIMANCCSIGKISSPSSIFYNIWYQGSLELKNCYYLDEIKETGIIANENTIAFSKNDESVLEALNEYVEEHKNDYEVELWNWEFNSDGLPVLEMGY